MTMLQIQKGRIKTFNLARVLNKKVRIEAYARIIQRRAFHLPCSHSCLMSPSKRPLSMMRQKGIRRLPIINKGQAAGVVTLKSIIGNIPDQSIELAELEASAEKAEVSCPYCGSHFEGKEDLSKHIDRLHIGSGLLEGDIRQL